MTEWDKLKERMMDYIKSMDDTPTEEQTTIYDLMVVCSSVGVSSMLLM